MCHLTEIQSCTYSTIARWASIDNRSGGNPSLLARAGPKEEQPRFSPDGRWVAYQSSESGSSEIYLRAFTAEEPPRVQVSVGGGHEPRGAAMARNPSIAVMRGASLVFPSLTCNGLRFGKPVTLFRF